MIECRIVAKVDELMALVDALETQLATARTAAEKFMEAIVAELTAVRVTPTCPCTRQQSFLELEKTRGLRNERR